MSKLTSILIFCRKCEPIAYRIETFKYLPSILSIMKDTNTDKAYEHLTNDEFMLLLSKTNCRRHRLAFLLSYGCGLRLSEIINLNKCDFDFNSNTILIKRKTNKKVRLVKIPLSFKIDFLKYIPFTFGQRALQKAFNRSCNSINKNKLPFHTLRNSFLKNSINNGVGFKSIKRQMGLNSLKDLQMFISLMSNEQRMAYINELRLSFNSNCKTVPAIGKNEIEILNSLEKDLGIKLERQYKVEGFYIDGFDKDNNIAYEVDEKHHLKQIQSDFLRERIIIESTGCTFVRIKDY